MRNLYEEEDETGRRPDTSISNRPPNEEINPIGGDAAERGSDGLLMSNSGGPDPDLVRSTIAERMASRFPSVSPLEMEPALDREQSGLDAARGVTRRNDQISNVAQAMDSFALGVNAPRVNSGLYSNLAKQSGRDETAAKEDIARKAQVRSAIQASSLREGELESAERDRGLKRDELRAYKDLARQDRIDREGHKLAENEESLMTNYGKARTKDDAKQLKAASEIKTSFDQKISELISIREAKGGEVLDREAVARARQLSKDLLLAYKDMSKLGVLSAADEAILNEIIPADPLQFNASGLVGQDPTMVKLKSFKVDVNRDFENRLNNRIRGGYKSEGSPAEPSQSLRPKTVSQNGHVYTLNEETGEYE